MVNFPDFVVLGVAKGGTTTLFKMLQQHPDIWLPPFKEIHFFDDAVNWDRGLNWYLEKFETAVTGKIRGDISPGYFERHNRVIPRMREVLAGREMPRLIVSLRNPIERAYSHWFFHECYYGGAQPFEMVVAEVLAAQTPDFEDSCFVSDSLYADRLEAWFELAGQENVKVVLADDLAENAGDVVNDILAFLGLEGGLDYGGIEEANVASVPISRTLMNFLSSPPLFVRKMVNAVFSESLKRDVRQKLYELNAKKKSKPKMKPEVRASLAEFYRSDIERTSRLIGRDLSKWQ